MLLEVTKVTDVGAPAAKAWDFIRDVPRLSGCLPNVGELAVLEPDRRYSAVVSDKLGPFRLQVPIQIEVRSIDEPREIVAELTGNDSRGQARVRGALQATIEARGDGAGTVITLGMRMEVLGRLAALGAGPMRRRADEIFNEFARCVQAELGAADTPEGVPPDGDHG